MSDYEHKKGKLKRVDTCGLSNEEVAASLVSKISTWNDTYLEELMYDNDDYEVINDVIYKVEVKDIDPSDDIFHASRIDDDTIEFDVKYYNGGCGFGEALEYAIKKMEEENEL